MNIAEIIFWGMLIPIAVFLFFKGCYLIFAGVVKIFQQRRMEKNRCDHRFDAADIHDFNIDPRCKKCKQFFSVIARVEHCKVQAVLGDENEYKTVPR